MDIVDEHSSVLQSCGSGTSCAVSVSSAAAVSHSYTAWLSTSPIGVSGGGGSAGPLTVTWATGLTATPTPTATPTLTPGCAAGGRCLTNLTALPYGPSWNGSFYTQYYLSVSMPDLRNTGWYVVVADEHGSIQTVTDGSSSSGPFCIVPSTCYTYLTSAAPAAHLYTAWLTTSTSGYAPGAASLSVDVSWAGAPTVTRTPTVAATATLTPSSTATPTASGSVTATATPSPGCVTDGTCLVSFTASPASPVLPGTSVTLTARSNKDVGDTPWFIDIVTAAGYNVLQSCASGSSCSVAVSSNSTLDTEPYMVFLSNSPTSVAGSSSLGPISITWSGPAPSPSATASPSTTLYFHNAPAMHGNSSLPSSTSVYWSGGVNAATTGANALSMGLLSGSSSGITAPSANAASYSEAAQFLSPPLAAGQVLQGTFSLGFAVQAFNQGDQISSYAYVGVLNAAGQPATTLFSLNQFSYATNTTQDMVPISASFPGSSYTTHAGDMLVVELGAYRACSVGGYGQTPCDGSTIAHPGNVGFDGSTPISALAPVPPSTYQTSHSPQSYLQVPANLQFLAVPLTNDSGIVPWHARYPVSLPAGMSAQVDLADGHLDLQYTDMSIPARGPDLALVHTWDSGAALAGTTTSAGIGWNTNLTARMSGAPGALVSYTDGTGAVWQFGYSTSKGAYLSPLGLPETLVASTSGYTLTNFLTGEALVFNAQGRFVSDTDSYGNANTLDGGGITYSNSGGRCLVLSQVS
jgi:hypothetical protein